MSIVLQEISHQYVAVEELVEGVDYQKYDWLVTQKARIRISQKCEKMRLIARTNRENSDLCLINGETSFGVTDRIYIYQDRQFVYSNYSVTYGIDIEFLVNINGIYINGVKRGFGRAIDSFIFPSMYSTNNGIFYIKEVDFDEHILSPCQLLQPIPAKLDSQGIARAAGECGMIDSVSRKFYGNNNTTGVFSVYNDEI